MNKNLFPIAKEGVLFILVGFFTLLLFLILELKFLLFIGLLTLIFLIFSFRNPERLVPEFSDLSVLAISDGVVNSIEEIDDTEYAYKIEIESSFLDVGILRAPFDATLIKSLYKNGAKVSKISELNLDLNEMLELTFQDYKKNKLKVVHRVKQSFSSIYCDLSSSQKIRQASRYGLMINGVTTIYLPHNFRVNVHVGDEIKSSESLMGYFS